MSSSPKSQDRSWPKATFLVGSECHRARKRPFSPGSQLSSPAHRPVSQQPLLAANTLLQVCVCPPQKPSPPQTLSSGSKEHPTGREAGSVPVPEGREERQGLRGGVQRGTEELFEIPACPPGGPSCQWGSSSSTEKETTVPGLAWAGTKSQAKEAMRQSRLQPWAHTSPNPVSPASPIVQNFSVPR